MKTRKNYRRPETEFVEFDYKEVVLASDPVEAEDPGSSDFEEDEVFNANKNDVERLN